MIRKTLLVTCMAALLGGCGEGSSPSGASGFSGFDGLATMPTTEPLAGAAEPVVGAAQPLAAATTPEATAPIASVPEQAEIEQVELVPAGANVVETTPVAVSPYVESITTNSEELVNVPESASSGITTEPNFLFDTARTISLKVDLVDAMGTQGSLSICTDYQETDSGYSINYNSCPIRGTVVNGQFDQDLSLMNQFDSAIAVIWFRNQEFAPRYQEFNTADLANTSQGQEWVWN